MDIRSAVVSQVVPAGFADLAQAADLLPGSELIRGGTSLRVHDSLGTGLVGAVRFAGTLRGSRMLPSLKVEVVVSPWSTGQSEVAIHPVTNLGHLDSFRARRFFKTALSVLPELIDRLTAGQPAQTPAVLELAA